MKEVWENVPGWETRYSVSSLGRIKVLKQRYRGVQYRTPTISDGRPYVTLAGDGRRASFSVGGLVLLAFRGVCPEGHQCCHKNDDPLDNRLSNLYWGTPKQNAVDRTRNGKTVRGERINTAKLTAAQVKRIRSRWKRGESQCALARAYGVQQGTIWYIVHEKTWRTPHAR